MFIFQKDNKGFQTWTVTDAVWEESHLLLLSTILGLPLMTQWLGIHLNAGVTGNAGLISELRRSSEEEMATHSRILARIMPWTEEPGGLQSLGSQRVRHDWVTEHTCTAVPPARSSPSDSEKWRKAQCTEISILAQDTTMENRKLILCSIWKIAASKKQFSSNFSQKNTK